MWEDGKYPGKEQTRKITEWCGMRSTVLNRAVGDAWLRRERS
jgi:hypothetical protein